MSDRFTFSQAMSLSTATGQGSGVIVRGVTMAAANCNAILFSRGIFGYSVSASSGSWGVIVQATAPDGTFVTIAGATAIGVAKSVFSPDAYSGTTFNTGIMRPSRLVYDKVQGGSGSLTGTFWGILANP